MMSGREIASSAIESILFDAQRDNQEALRAAFEHTSVNDKRVHMVTSTLARQAAELSQLASQIPSPPPMPRRGARHASRKKLFRSESRSASPKARAAVYKRKAVPRSESNSDAASANDSDVDEAELFGDGSVALWSVNGTNKRQKKQAAAAAMLDDTVSSNGLQSTPREKQSLLKTYGVQSQSVQILWLTSHLSANERDRVRSALHGFHTGSLSVVESAPFLQSAAKVEENEQSESDGNAAASNERDEEPSGERSGNGSQESAPQKVDDAAEDGSATEEVVEKKSDGGTDSEQESDEGEKKREKEWVEANEAVRKERAQRKRDSSVLCVVGAAADERSMSKDPLLVHMLARGATIIDVLTLLHISDSVENGRSASKELARRKGVRATRSSYKTFLRLHVFKPRRLTSQYKLFLDAPPPADEATAKIARNAFHLDYFWRIMEEIRQNVRHHPFMEKELGELVNLKFIQGPD